MKQGQYWSEDYNCPVSLSFYSGVIKRTKTFKIDITNCIIIISKFGFYSLWLNNKKIQDLTFLEFLKYKKFVKEIVNNDRGQDYD